MTQLAKTKEENFLCRFAALEGCENFMEIEDIAIALQTNPRGLKNIVRLLAQANCLKKRGNTIALTAHGRRLAAEV